MFLIFAKEYESTEVPGEAEEMYGSMTAQTAIHGGHGYSYTYDTYDCGNTVRSGQTTPVRRTRSTGRHSRRRKGERARSFQFQKFLLFLAFTLLLAFLCGITFGSILSSAKGSEEKKLDTFKYYKSVTIEQGDSLWNIARENMTPEYDSINDYIEEVCFINSLDGTQIHAGCSLTVPYYSSEFK